MLGLGRIDEARAASRVVTESVRHPYRCDLFDNWSFSAIPRALLLGDREMALPLIREAVSAKHDRQSGRTAAGSPCVSR